MAARFEVAFIRIAVGLIATGLLPMFSLPAVATIQKTIDPLAGSTPAFCPYSYQEMTTQAFLIRVLDGHYRPIMGATVVVKIGEVEAPAIYDSKRAGYLLDPSILGTAVSRQFVLKVSHPDYSNEMLDLRIPPATEYVTVYLGREGDSYTYIDGLKFPYKAQPNRISIVARSANIGQLDSIAAALGLRVERWVGGRAIVVVKDGSFDRYNSEDLRILRSSEAVLQAGAIFSQDDGAITLFTNQIKVRFRSEAIPSDGYETLRRFGLSNIQRIEGASNAYLAEADPAIGEGINDIMERLLKEPAIEMVSPEFASVVRPD